jgi:hypothetical protein
VTPRRAGAAPPLFLNGAVLTQRSRDREHRVGLWRYVVSGDIATLVTAPLVYSLLVAFVLMDGWISVYQAICFRAWGIRRVRRRDYFAIDRHKLAYLNAIERVNCLYCSYANGVIGYVREIAARTEQYWCPIRHARRLRHAHGRYAHFAPYGDGRRYRDRLPLFRASLKR